MYVSTTCRVTVQKSHRHAPFDRVTAGGKKLLGYFTDVRVQECGIVCRLLYRTSGGPAKEGTNIAVKGSIIFVYPHIFIGSTGIQRVAPSVLGGGNGNSVPRVYFAGTLTDRVAAVRNGDASKFTFQVVIPGPVQTRVRCTCLRASKLIAEAPRLFEGHYVAIVGHLGEQPGGMLDVVVVSFACLIYPEDIAKRAREIWPGREGGDETRVVGFYLPVNEPTSDEDAEGSTDDEVPGRHSGGDGDALRAARPSFNASGTASAITFPGTPVDTPARIMPAQLAVVHTAQAYSSPLPTAETSPSSRHVSNSTLTSPLASSYPSFHPDANMDHSPSIERPDASSTMVVAAPYATQPDPSMPDFSPFANASMQSVPIVDDAISTTPPAAVDDTLASQSSLYGALGPAFHELQSPAVGEAEMGSGFAGDAMDVDPPRFAAAASLGFAIDGKYADIQSAEPMAGISQGEQSGSLPFGTLTAGVPSDFHPSPPAPTVLEPSSRDHDARSARSEASLTPSPVAKNVDIAEASLADPAPAELFSGPEDLPQRLLETRGESGAGGNESFSDLMHEAFDHYRWAAEHGPDDLTSTMDPDELFDTYLDHE